MNFKKIIIYRNDVLFGILDEIKEILNYDLIKVNEKNFKKFEADSLSDFVIVSDTEIKKYKNLLHISNYPIKIDKLIQLINLKFLKNKFNSQSDLAIKSYKLNLNSRIMAKGDKFIDLTEREINLILFLKKATLAVKIDKLQKDVWGHISKLETHTVETHIYRLRKKIKEKFDDENFIISSKEGYSIN